MLRNVDIDAVMRLVEALPAHVPRVVASDADGTLWQADVGDEIFVDLAARSDFRGLAAETLRARAAEHLGDVVHDDLAMAHALMAKYRAGQLSIEAICTLEAEALGERTHDDVAAVYARVAERIAATVHDDVRALLNMLRTQGWSVHVVSGSLGDAVEACMRYAEIPYDTAAGATLVREGDVVRAKLAAAVPLFDGKVRALREVGAWPAGLGLGDGGWDVSFLRECALPVLVRPKLALLDAMAGHPRAVVLA